MHLPSLFHLLSEAAAREGDRDLYVFLDAQDDTRRMTCRRSHERACAIATHLREVVGLSSGDRALLLYPPGLEFIEAFFGCWYARVIAVPAGLPKPKRSSARLEGSAASCRPAAVLIAEQTSLSPSFAVLPAYMVPSIFVPVTTFPPTASGKPERRALAAASRDVARK